MYNWVVENCDLPAKPRQIEFARLGIDHTVMSKRKLRRLVEEGRVSGWDDPRMPTLCGLRRRGYTPKSIRNFCERIGVAKSANVVSEEEGRNLLAEIFIPFTVGGGIRTIQDIKKILRAGADKVSLNSAASVENRYRNLLFLA